MKTARMVLALAAILCLVCVGCVDKEKAAREKRLTTEIKDQIAALKAEKKGLETVADSLNHKIARLNLAIVRLEGASQDLFEPPEKPSFWESFDWVAQQINLVILGLFVVWLFYSLYLRRGAGRK